MSSRKLCALFAIYLFVLWPMEVGSAVAQGEERPEDAVDLVQRKIDQGERITAADLNRLSDSELRDVLSRNRDDFARLLEAMDLAHLQKVQDMLQAAEIQTIIANRPELLAQLDVGELNPAELAAGVRDAFDLQVPNFELRLARGAGCRIAERKLSCGNAPVDLRAVGMHNAAVPGEQQIIGIALDPATRELTLLRGNAAQNIVIGSGITSVRIADGAIFLSGGGEELEVENGRVTFDGKFLLDVRTRVTMRGITFVAEGRAEKATVSLTGSQVTFSGAGKFEGYFAGSKLPNGQSTLAFTFDGQIISRIEGKNALYVARGHLISGDFSAAVTREIVEKKDSNGNVLDRVEIENLEVTLNPTDPRSYYEQRDSELRVAINSKHPEAVTVHACGGVVGFSPMCGGSDRTIAALTEAKDLQQAANAATALTEKAKASGDWKEVEEFFKNRGITCNGASCSAALEQFEQRVSEKRNAVAATLSAGNNVYLSADGQFWLADGVARVDFSEPMGAVRFRRIFLGSEGGTLGYGAMGEEVIIDHYGADVENFAMLRMEVGVQRRNADGQFVFEKYENADQGALFLDTRFSKQGGSIHTLVRGSDLGRMQELRDQLRADGGFLAVPDFRITPMDNVNSITFNRDATQAFLSIAQRSPIGETGVVDFGTIQAEVDKYIRNRRAYVGLAEIAIAVPGALSDAEIERLKQRVQTVDSYYEELAVDNVDLTNKLLKLRGPEQQAVRLLIEGNQLSAAGDTAGALAQYAQVGGSFSGFASAKSGDLYFREGRFGEASSSYVKALAQSSGDNELRLKLLQSYLGAKDSTNAATQLATLDRVGGSVSSRANQAYGNYLELGGNTEQAIAHYARAFQLSSGAAQQGIAQELVRALASAQGAVTGTALDKLTAADFEQQLAGLINAGTYADQLKGIDLSALKDSYIAAQFAEAAGAKGISVDLRVTLLEQSVTAEAHYGNLLDLAQAYRAQGNIRLAELARQRAEQILNEQSRQAGYAYDAGREQQRIAVKLLDAEFRFAEAQQEWDAVQRGGAGAQEAQRSFAAAIAALGDLSAHYNANDEGVKKLASGMALALALSGKVTEARAVVATNPSLQSSEAGKLLASREAVRLLEAAGANREKVAQQRQAGKKGDDLALAQGRMYELQAQQVAGLALGAEEREELVQLQINVLLQSGEKDSDLKAIEKIGELRGKYPELAAMLKEMETRIIAQRQLRYGQLSTAAHYLTELPADAGADLRLQYEVQRMLSTQNPERFSAALALIDRNTDPELKGLRDALRDNVQLEQRVAPIREQTAVGNFAEARATLTRVELNVEQRAAFAKEIDLSEFRSIVDKRSLSSADLERLQRLRDQYAASAESVSLQVGGKVQEVRVHDYLAQQLAAAFAQAAQTAAQQGELDAFLAQQASLRTTLADTQIPLESGVMSVAQFVGQLQGAIAQAAAARTDGSYAQARIAEFLNAQDAAQTTASIRPPPDAPRVSELGKDWTESGALAEQVLGIKVEGIYLDPATGKIYKSFTEGGETYYAAVSKQWLAAEGQRLRGERALAEQSMTAELRQLDPVVLASLETQYVGTPVQQQIATVREVRERIAELGGVSEALQALSRAAADAAQDNSGWKQLFSTQEDERQEHADQLLNEVKGYVAELYAGLSEGKLRQEVQRVQSRASTALGTQFSEEYDTREAMLGGDLLRWAMSDELRDAKAEYNFQLAQLQALQGLVAAQDVRKQDPALEVENSVLFATLVQMRQTNYGLEALNHDAEHYGGIDTNNVRVQELHGQQLQEIDTGAAQLSALSALLPMIEEPQRYRQALTAGLETKAAVRETAYLVHEQQFWAYLSRSAEEAGRSPTGFVDAVFDLGIWTSFRAMTGALDDEITTFYHERDATQLEDIATRRTLDILKRTETDIRAFQSGSGDIGALVDQYAAATGREYTHEQRGALINALVSTQQRNALDPAFDPNSVVTIVGENLVDSLFNIEGTLLTAATSAGIMRATKVGMGMLGLAEQTAGSLAARSTTAFGQQVFGSAESILAKTTTGIEGFAAGKLNPFYWTNKVDGFLNRLLPSNNAISNIIKYEISEIGVEEVLLPKVVGGIGGQHAADSLDTLETALGLRRGSNSVRFTQTVDVDGNIRSYARVNGNVQRMAAETFGDRVTIEPIRMGNGRIVADSANPHPQAVRITERNGNQLIVAVAGTQFDQQQVQIHDDAVLIGFGQSADLRVLTTTATPETIATRLGSVVIDKGATVTLADGTRLSGVLIADANGAQKLIVQTPLPAEELRVSGVEAVYPNGQRIEHAVAVTRNIRDEIAQNIAQHLQSGRATGVMVESVRNRQKSFWDITAKTDLNELFGIAAWRKAFKSNARAIQEYAAEIVNTINRGSSVRDVGVAVRRLQELGVLDQELNPLLSDPTVQEFVAEVGPTLLRYQQQQRALAASAATAAEGVALERNAAGDVEGARTALEIAAHATATARAPQPAAHPSTPPAQPLAAHIAAETVLQSDGSVQVSTAVAAIVAEAAGMSLNELARAVEERTLEKDRCKVGSLDCSPEVRSANYEESVERAVTSIAEIPPSRKLANDLRSKIQEQRSALQQLEEGSPQAAVLRREVELTQREQDLAVAIDAAVQRGSTPATFTGTEGVATQQQSTEALIDAASRAQTEGERIAALNAFALSRDAAAVAALEEVAQNPERTPLEQAYAANSIGNVLRNIQLERIAAGEELAPRTAAVQAGAITAMQDMLNPQNDPMVRWSAANALRMINTPESGAVLAAHLQDSDATVRVLAVRSVANRAGVVAVGYVARAQGTPEQQEQAAAELERKLGEALPKETALPALEEILKSYNAGEREFGAVDLRFLPQRTIQARGEAPTGESVALETRIAELTALERTLSGDATNRLNAEGVRNLFDIDLEALAHAPPAQRAALIGTYTAMVQDLGVKLSSIATQDGIAASLGTERAVNELIQHNLVELYVLQVPFGSANSIGGKALGDALKQETIAYLQQHGVPFSLSQTRFRISAQPGQEFQGKTLEQIIQEFPSAVGGKLSVQFPTHNAEIREFRMQAGLHEVSLEDILKLAEVTDAHVQALQEELQSMLGELAALRASVGEDREQRSDVRKLESDIHITRKAIELYKVIIRKSPRTGVLRIEEELAESMVVQGFSIAAAKSEHELTREVLINEEEYRYGEGIIPELIYDIDAAGNRLADHGRLPRVNNQVGYLFAKDQRHADGSTFNGLVTQYIAALSTVMGSATQAEKVFALSELPEFVESAKAIGPMQTQGDLLAALEQLQRKVQDRVAIFAERSQRDPRYTGAYQEQYFAPAVRALADAHGSVQLVFLEVDGFKAFNERYAPDSTDSSYHGILDIVRFTSAEAGIPIAVTKAGDEITIAVQGNVAPDVLQAYLQDVQKQVKEKFSAPFQELKKFREGKKIVRRLGWVHPDGRVEWLTQAEFDAAYGPLLDTYRPMPKMATLGLTVVTDTATTFTAEQIDGDWDRLVDHTFVPGILTRHIQRLEELNRKVKAYAKGSIKDAAVIEEEFAQYDDGLARAAVEEAFEDSFNPEELPDAGSALVQGIAVNIGDSRIYVRSAAREMVQLSKDDSYVQQWVDGGTLTEAEAETHPLRNKITRSVSAEHQLVLEDHQRILQKLNPGEMVVAMSDGIIDNLGRKRIGEVGLQHSTETALADEFVNTALRISRDSKDPYHKPDDIGIAIIGRKVRPDGEAPEPLSAVAPVVAPLPAKPLEQLVMDEPVTITLTAPGKPKVTITGRVQVEPRKQQEGEGRSLRDMVVVTLMSGDKQYRVTEEKNNLGVEYTVEELQQKGGLERVVDFARALLPKSKLEWGAVSALAIGIGGLGSVLLAPVGLGYAVWKWRTAAKVDTAREFRTVRTWKIAGSIADRVAVNGQPISAAPQPAPKTPLRYQVERTAGVIGVAGGLALFMAGWVAAGPLVAIGSISLLTYAFVRGKTARAELPQPVTELEIRATQVPALAKTAQRVGAAAPTLEAIAAGTTTLPDGTVQVDGTTTDAIAAKTGLTAEELAEEVERRTPTNDDCRAGSIVCATPDPNEASAVQRALSDIVAERTELPKALVLDRYEVYGIIGHGSYGTVYKAHDTQTDTDVALKVIRKAVLGDTDSVNRDVRQEHADLEARIQKAVEESPAGVRVRDVHHNVEAFDGLPVIVMDYVRGKDLGDARPEIDGDDKLRIAEELVSTIATLHAQGFLHLDLKPGNVVVDTDGNAKLIDYGLAMPTAEATALSKGLGHGTLLWSDRRQFLERPLDEAADTIALGRVLYFLFSGRHPHFDMEKLRGFSQVQLMKHMTHGELAENWKPVPPLIASRPWEHQLNALILEMLREQPAQRPAMAEVQQRLSRILLEQQTDITSGAIFDRDAMARLRTATEPELNWYATATPLASQQDLEERVQEGQLVKLEDTAYVSVLREAALPYVTLELRNLITRIGETWDAALAAQGLNRQLGIRQAVTAKGGIPALLRNTLRGVPLTVLTMHITSTVTI